MPEIPAFLAQPKFMIMRLALLISFLIFFSAAFTQSKRDYIWLFGYNSNGDTPGAEGVVLDFNQVPVEISATQMELVLNWNYSGICDTIGNLLLYTNGCAVANGQHQIIENGEGLNPGELHDDVCSDLGYPIQQSVIIFPKPGNSSRYFIFHERAIKNYEPQFEITVDVLFLTEVQISGLDDGLVITKNIPVIQDPLHAGELTAIKHTNGIDMWLMVPRKHNNKYYTLLITEEGIADTLEQEIGLPATSAGEGGGQAIFSPDGLLYLRSNPSDGTFIFDFDRSTGILSNFRFIPPFDDGSLWGGLAVSPNSRFLYVFTSLHAFQYDLWVADIPASEVLIAEYDGFMNPFATIFYQGRIGPDCKIYVNSSATVRNLHVIHHPNEKGLACGFEQHGITLPHNQGRTLPNLPSNFNLDIGPPCDSSLIISAVWPFRPAKPEKLFRIFPNPAGEYVMVEPEKRERLKDIRVQLSNALGEVVLRQIMEGLPFILDTKVLASGVYTLGIYSDQRLVQSERVVIFKDY